jgi:hypothetical protein
MNLFDEDTVIYEQISKETQRREIAMAAMSGLLANSANTPENCCYAREAVKRADQLLYALENNPPNSIS